MVKQEQSSYAHRSCQNVLDSVIAELEENDWLSRVPQPPRTDLYYSTLRYLTNALQRSRLVNNPKTQAMFDYEVLSKQWYENFEDRLNGARDLLLSAAAHQVLYYDGLRFVDELNSVKNVLPQLKLRVQAALEKLDKTIGNKTQWDICQSQIAESGQSKLIEIHSNTTIIYKKVLKSI